MAPTVGAFLTPHRLGTPPHRGRRLGEARGRVGASSPQDKVQCASGAAVAARASPPARPRVPGRRRRRGGTEAAMAQRAATAQRAARRRRPPPYDWSRHTGGGAPGPSARPAARGGVEDRRAGTRRGRDPRNAAEPAKRCEGMWRGGGRTGGKVSHASRITRGGGTFIWGKSRITITPRPLPGRASRGGRQTGRTLRHAGTPWDIERDLHWYDRGATASTWWP